MSIDNQDSPVRSTMSNTDFLHIGSGFKLVGTVTGSALCVINGCMEGTLQSDAVKVNSGATMMGEINCTRLDAGGDISGVIKTQDVLLRSTAVIRGDVHYQTIVIEKGAIIDGDIHRVVHSTSVQSLDDVYQWVLSAEVRELIPLAKVVTLTLGDGSPLPLGFGLQGSCIVVNRQKFIEHVKNGGVRSFSLKLDDQTFSMDMPVESGVPA